MKEEKHILIISYVFPPYPGIGGRRWAKYAKYLALKGYKIHIIAAQNPFDETSKWTKDIDNGNIICHYLPSSYPTILLKKPESVLEKIEYKLAEQILYLRTKGTIYERSLFWGKSLMTKANELIEKFKIQNVIASGAPFYVLYHSTFLKERFQKINLIIDYRDQWTDNDSFMGYNTLSQKRLNYEKEIEKKVLTYADVVTTVANQMTENLRTKSLSYSKAKFITLNNGFDEDDIPKHKLLDKKNDGKIRFILTGNLYNNVEYVFEPLLNLLKEIKLNDALLYECLQFDFYGDAPIRYKEQIDSNNLDIIHFHSSIPLAKVFEKINESDLCMLFLNHDLTFSLSTKFFEYIAMRKKMVVFSSKGELSKYVLENNIGYSVTPENFKNDFYKIIKDFEEKKIMFNTNFDVNQFNILQLTTRLESLFI